MILIISIIFLLIHQSIIKNKSSSFIASTEIRPISVAGANEYIVFKDLDSSYVEFIGKIESVSHLDEDNSIKKLGIDNNLDTDIIIDRNHFIGKPDKASSSDFIVQSALSTIIDNEDSVAAVDAEDKVRCYRNWLGLMKGDLAVNMEKNGFLIKAICL